MKKLASLFSWIGLVAVMALFTFQLESCSHPGMVSCPDLHRSHHNIDLARRGYHHAKTVASAKQVSKAQPDNTTATVKHDLPAVESISSKGIASASDELPKFNNPKELFKILTTDERNQVKDEVSTLFSQKPFLKKIAMKKMEKLDKKYPAPAQSSFKKDGGSLTTGEILAIVAIVLSLTFFLSIAGLIIGIIALHKIKNDGGRDWAKILAIVAIIIGALLTLLFIIWLILFIALASFAF